MHRLRDSFKAAAYYQPFVKHVSTWALDIDPTVVIKWNYGVAKTSTHKIYFSGEQVIIVQAREDAAYMCRKWVKSTWNGSCRIILKKSENHWTWGQKLWLRLDELRRLINSNIWNPFWKKQYKCFRDRKKINRWKKSGSRVKFCFCRVEILSLEQKIYLPSLSPTWTLISQHTNKILAAEMDVRRRGARKSRKEELVNDTQCSICECRKQCIRSNWRKSVTIVWIYEENTRK